MPILTPQIIDQVAEKLAHFVADSFVLYVKTLNFHWNMVGREFFMFHRLLEEQYKELQEAIDEMAERLRQLGKEAPGSMKQFLELACLKESTGRLGLEQMVQELVDNHQQLIEHCHLLIAFTDKVLDQGTSDMLAQRIRSHAKQAWLLQSHLTT